MKFYWGTFFLVTTKTRTFSDSWDSSSSSPFSGSSSACISSLHHLTCFLVADSEAIEESDSRSPSLVFRIELTRFLFGIFEINFRMSSEEVTKYHVFLCQGLGSPSTLLASNGLDFYQPPCREGQARSALSSFHRREAFSTITPFTCQEDLHY